MAAQRGVLFHEKVSRLLSRQDGKPVLKPNKPLALRDAVSNRKLKKGEATCITEMSVLMACWKQNNFVDSLCSNEVKAFYTCVNEAKAAVRNKLEHSQTLPGGHLHPNTVNTLLKRYPSLPTEI